MPCMLSYLVLVSCLHGPTIKHTMTKYFEFIHIEMPVNTNTKDLNDLRLKYQFDPKQVSPNNKEKFQQEKKLPGVVFDLTVSGLLVIYYP